ncbi:MAG TPA: hypothetical protein VI997_00850 [Candidatus Thermoplasmatota archaeon]|nr:hypothetical protein [Candidatus Thermoplasmatota archaeon]
MRLFAVVAALAIVTVLPTALGATVHVVQGTYPGWITPVVVVEKGDTVIFTTLESTVDGCHPAFVTLHVPTGDPPLYDCTTEYLNVGAQPDVPAGHNGVFDFRCVNHSHMVGRLIVQ